MSADNNSGPIVGQDSWTPDLERYFGADRRGARQLAFTWRLIVAARKWRTHVDNAMSALGQTHGRHEILSVIRFAPPGISQRDLARLARIESPTLIRILNKLQRDGLIRRSPSGQDIRAKTVELTPLGLEQLEKQSQIGASLRNASLSRLTDDELDQASAVLDKFIRSL